MFGTVMLEGFRTKVYVVRKTFVEVASNFSQNCHNLSKKF